jgi:hypothetical protein
MNSFGSRFRSASATPNTAGWFGLERKFCVTIWESGRRLSKIFSPCPGRLEALPYFGRGWLLGAICLIGLLVSLSGCATGPRIDWNSRIGTYTYDQAVLELGPPDRSATLGDNTKVVEWLTSRGQAYGFADYGAFYHPYHFYGGPFVHHYSLSRGPDYYLRLTFSPEGRLVAWARVAR